MMILSIRPLMGAKQPSLQQENQAMNLLLDSLGLSVPFYFVADAYYANGKTVRGLLAKGNHLVTRVKSNSVAYFPASP